MKDIIKFVVAPIFVGLVLKLVDKWLENQDND